MEQKKFIVLSGNKRSGTSMMMLAMRECGIPISGFKYPVKIRNKDADQVDAGCMFPMDEHLSKCSPSGFWEYASVIEEGLQKKHESYNGLFIKVPVHVLTKSCRDLIEKVVLIVRNPRKVIASRINVGELVVQNDKDIELASIIYLNNIVYALQWMRKVSLRFKLVVYEEVIEDPFAILQSTCDWIGRGDAGFGDHVISYKLDRTKPLEIDSPLMAELDEMYDMLKMRNFDRLYDIDVKEYNRRYNEIYNSMAKEDNNQTTKMEAK